MERGGGGGATENVAPLSSGPLLRIKRELVSAESGFPCRPSLVCAWEAVPVGALLGEDARGEERAGGNGRDPLVVACCTGVLVADAPAVRGAGATNDQHTIRLLQSAVKNLWIVGGFCSSHEWGVCYQHTSANCKNKPAGHKDSTTRANPAGPGRTKNQGWVAFT